MTCNSFCHVLLMPKLFRKPSEEYILVYVKFYISMKGCCPCNINDDDDNEMFLLYLHVFF